MEFPLISSWSRLSFRRKGSVIIGIPIACLIVTLVAFGWLKENATIAQNYVEHTQLVRYEANQLLTALVDAETGIRGYEITREMHFLEPYQGSVFTIPEQLYRLENLVADNPRQLRQVERIHEVSRKNLDFFRDKLSELNLDSDDFAEDPQVRQLMIRGKNLMDQARAEISVFLSEEERLLALRTEESQQQQEFIEKAIWIEATFGIISGFLAVYLFRKLDRELQIRQIRLQEAADLSEQQAQDLSITVEKLRETQATLIQKEKMSSLGQLVAGIAHEINNPISFIYGNITHIQDIINEAIEPLKELSQRNDLPPEVREQIEEIDLEFLEQDSVKILNSMSYGSERIRDIVKSLRSFSRLDESEKKSVDIHQGLKDTLLILSHRLSDIEVYEDYADLPNIECYAGEVNQVLINVLSNAIDAVNETAPPRKIFIKTQGDRDRDSDRDSDREGILVEIKDTGMGIPEEIQDKIFDPFFTTKTVGKGTGLGLSVSYQIIHKHQGKIWIDSLLGEGTQVFIFLPR